MRKVKQSRRVSLTTTSIHGDRFEAYRGPVVEPIYQTTTYRFEDSDDAVRYAKGDPKVLVYTRYHNPTVNAVEKKIALLYQNGQSGSLDTALFSSGMAAITTAVLACATAGSEIVSTPALYGGTYRFFRDTIGGFGVAVKWVDPRSLDDLKYLITPKTKLVYLETPTNPTLSLVDIAALCKRVRQSEREFKSKITVLIDNTFATLVNQNPFRFGVDAVADSTTKYLGGHADFMGGAVTGSPAFIKKVKALAKHFGGCADPFAAFLLDRSLKTFEMRVGRHNENALALATALERNKRVSRVLYPGLKSHPQHKMARAQMTGFGGMVTIELKGGLKAAVRVCDALRVAVNAMSLGGVETLVSIPVYSSHINMGPRELASHGVTPGMIRISVGVEGAGDLIEDFQRALSKA